MKRFVFAGAISIDESDFETLESFFDKFPNSFEVVLFDTRTRPLSRYDLSHTGLQRILLDGHLLGR